MAFCQRHQRTVQRKISGDHEINAGIKFQIEFLRSQQFGRFLYAELFDIRAPQKRQQIVLVDDEAGAGLALAAQVAQIAARVTDNQIIFTDGNLRLSGNQRIEIFEFLRIEACGVKVYMAVTQLSRQRIFIIFQKSDMRVGKKFQQGKKRRVEQVVFCIPVLQ